MSYSYTFTASETFTLTHARKLAGKVVTDMIRFSQSYGQPSQTAIQNYGEELTTLLKDGYVETYEFGFKQNETRIVSCYYTVDSSGTLLSDDRPGQIPLNANVSAGAFFNFITYSDKWSKLNQAERDSIKAGLPVSRGTGTAPTDGYGYWVADKTYSAGGVNLPRRSFKPF